MRKDKIAVIGIGRVGLPLALVFAESGFISYGLDVNQDLIESLKKRKMPFFEKGGSELLKKHTSKNFFPTKDFSVVKNCQYIILTLGTPVDENMNPSYVQINSALKTLMPFFIKDQTLILRSTVSPGTTNYVKQILTSQKRFTIGKDFFLAFCPERIAEARAIEEIKTIPQIIGGVDKESNLHASRLFSKLGIECLISDDVSSELAKLFTNMYRYINFAIANEFMTIASSHHRDIYEIVNLVNHNYKRGGLSIPGLTGGPCLFKDGFFLVNDLPYTDLIVTSWKINETIPVFLIRQIRDRIKLAGKKTVILGLAFKANVDDTRESLSFKVKKALEGENAVVYLHDPWIKGYDDDVYEIIKGTDLIFIATNHDFYKSLDLEKVKKLVSKKCVICDIWNIFKTNRIIFTINSLYNHSVRKGK
jgi:UDP-N-acetyl-D-mannosaminuronic acid dehydrogenase